MAPIPIVRKEDLVGPVGPIQPTGHQCLDWACLSPSEQFGVIFGGIVGTMLVTVVLLGLYVRYKRRQDPEFAIDWVDIPARRRQAMLSRPHPLPAVPLHGVMPQGPPRALLPPPHSEYSGYTSDPRHGQAQVQIPCMQPVPRPALTVPYRDTPRGRAHYRQNRRRAFPRPPSPHPRLLNAQNRRARVFRTRAKTGTSLCRKFLAALRLRASKVNNEAVPLDYVGPLNSTPSPRLSSDSSDHNEVIPAAQPSQERKRVASSISNRNRAQASSNPQPHRQCRGRPPSPYPRGRQPSSSDDSSDDSSMRPMRASSSSSFSTRAVVNGRRSQSSDRSWRGRARAAVSGDSASMSSSSDEYSEPNIPRPTARAPRRGILKDPGPGTPGSEC